MRRPRPLNRQGWTHPPNLGVLTLYQIQEPLQPRRQFLNGLVYRPDSFHPRSFFLVHFIPPVMVRDSLAGPRKLVSGCNPITGRTENPALSRIENRCESGIVTRRTLSCFCSIDARGAPSRTPSMPHHLPARVEAQTRTPPPTPSPQEESRTNAPHTVLRLDYLFPGRPSAF